MAQTAVKTANLLYKLVENARIPEIRTVRDLHELVKLIDTFEKLNSDSDAELAEALNAVTLPQPSIKRLQTKAFKTKMLKPGMNGQEETV